MSRPLSDLLLHPFARPYKTIATEVEAIQFTGENDDAIFDFARPNAYRDFTKEGTPMRFWKIKTLPDSHLTLEMGDWLVKTAPHEIEVCKPDIFAATYEPVAATKEGEAQDVIAEVHRALDRAVLLEQIVRLKNAIEGCESKIGMAAVWSWADLLYAASAVSGLLAAPNSSVWNTAIDIVMEMDTDAADWKSRIIAASKAARDSGGNQSLPAYQMKQWKRWRGKLQTP